MIREVVSISWLVISELYTRAKMFYLKTTRNIVLVLLVAPTPHGFKTSTTLVYMIYGRASNWLWSTWVQSCFRSTASFKDFTGEHYTDILVAHPKASFGHGDS